MVAAAQSRGRGSAAAGHGVVLRRAGCLATTRTRCAGAVPDQSRRMERSRDDGAVLATMASRGSVLRRRLESLLDDAPRSRRAVGPWLAVTTVAVPVVCLAPVVTIASLSRVPAAAVRLVEHAPASKPPAARVMPFPRVADA